MDQEHHTASVVTIWTKPDKKPKFETNIMLENIVCKRFQELSLLLERNKENEILTTLCIFGTTTNPSSPIFISRGLIAFG